MISQKDFAYDCQKNLYCQLGLTIHEEKGTLYSQTGVPHPLLNGVVRCKTTDVDIERVVQKVFEYFKNLGLPHSWWVEASEAPVSLRHQLERRGLNYLGNFSVMAITIDNTFLSTKSDANVDVIVDETPLSDWGKILSRSFQISQPALSIFLGLMQNASHSGHFTNVLAHKDGKGVATGSITFTREGAYICNDCTLEEERDFGYGKAVTSKLLEIALKRGSQRIAVISAPSETADYKKLGFVEEGTYQIYS
jgi:hypothetical protein